MINNLFVQLVPVLLLFGLSGSDPGNPSADYFRRNVISCAPESEFSITGPQRIKHPRLIYPGDPSDDPKILANDNAIPGGTLIDNILQISLEVKWGDLFMETDSRPGLKMVAISEKGKAPSIPAPLIRIKTGTLIHAELKNTLKDSTVTVFGLQKRPAAVADSIVIKPGETKDIRFESGKPGTYFYWVKLGAGNDPQTEEEEQLYGAFIVDPEEGSPPDRVMVINIFSTPIDTSLFKNGWLESLTINGKSWPYTELMTPSVGDTLRWRVINASYRVHPMHLHGFMYHVISNGKILSDNIFKPEMQPSVVTETMMPRTTMHMKWVASRPGNWLFHCHLSFHVTPGFRLPGAAALDDAGHKPHMAGLVIGIKIKPGTSDLISKGDEKKIDLFANQYNKDFSSPLGFSFLPDKLSQDHHIASPGPVLILKQYQPTFVTVFNRMTIPTSVHWHGLDLDSWADGVPGWSSSDGKSSPIIQPGEKFTYQLTLMRPGTYIYHSHLDDVHQLSSGLFGPLIVMGENETYDPATDHNYIVGWKNEDPQTLDDMELNGAKEQPRQFAVTGETHRLRLMNIAPAGLVKIKMVKDGKAVPIIFIAKDGIDMPDIQQVHLQESQRFGVGETADFLFKPEKSGNYILEVITNITDTPWTQEWIVKDP